MCTSTLSSSEKNSRPRTSTTTATRSMLDPVAMRSTSGTSIMGGRLSTTYQSRSSSTAAARVRPAPDIPVMISTWGSLRSGPCVAASTSAIPSGAVVGEGSVLLMPPSMPASALESGNDRLRRLVPHAAHARDLVDARRLEPLERAEVGEQHLLARRAETGHVVEHRGGHALAAPPAVLGDREPVGLVADALQQGQAFAGALQDDGVLLPRQPDLLQALGQTAQGDVGDAELVHRLLGGSDLGRAAVDHHEARRVGEAVPVARVVRRDLAARQRAGGVVRAGVLTPRELDVVRSAPVGGGAPAPPGDDLVHGLGVVACAVAVRPADAERAVLALAGQAVLEHDHRRRLVGALRVRDVVALDAQRRGLEVERLLDLAQRLAPRGEVPRAPGAVQHQRVLGVLADGGSELPLVPALRHADVDPGAAQTAQPGAHLVEVGGQHRAEHLARYRVARLDPAGLLDGPVHLLQQVLDELAVGDVLDLLDDPATLTADAP